MGSADFWNILIFLCKTKSAGLCYRRIRISNISTNQFFPTQPVAPRPNLGPVSGVFLFNMQACYVLKSRAFLQSFNQPEIRVTQGPGGTPGGPTQYILYYCVCFTTHISILCTPGGPWGGAAWGGRLGGAIWHYFPLSGTIF